MGTGGLGGLKLSGPMICCSATWWTRPCMETGCKVQVDQLDWVACNRMDLMFVVWVDLLIDGPGCEGTGEPVVLGDLILLLNNLVDLSINGPGWEGTGGPVGLGGL